MRTAYYESWCWKARWRCFASAHQRLDALGTCAGRTGWSRLDGCRMVTRPSPL